MGFDFTCINIFISVNIKDASAKSTGIFQSFQPQSTNQSSVAVLFTGTTDCIGVFISYYWRGYVLRIFLLICLIISVIRSGK